MNPPHLHTCMHRQTHTERNTHMSNTNKDVSSVNSWGFFFLLFVFQCTDVNIQSYSPFSWSFRVQSVRSVNCEPPQSWRTTTQTTASPAKPSPWVTWRKCQDATSPSPGEYQVELTSLAGLHWYSLISLYNTVQIFEWSFYWAISVETQFNHSVPTCSSRLPIFGENDHSNINRMLFVRWHRQQTVAVKWGLWQSREIKQ